MNEVMPEPMTPELAARNRRIILVVAAVFVAMCVAIIIWSRVVTQESRAQARVTDAAPVGLGFQQGRQAGHIAQAQVQALAGQGVYGVGGVSGQHPDAIGMHATPLARRGAHQRPNRTLADQRQGAQAALAGSEQGSTEFLLGFSLQSLRAPRR